MHSTFQVTYLFQYIYTEKACRLRIEISKLHNYQPLNNLSNPIYITAGVCLRRVGWLETFRYVSLLCILYAI